MYISVPRKDRHFLGPKLIVVNIANAIIGCNNVGVPYIFTSRRCALNKHHQWAHPHRHLERDCFAARLDPSAFPLDSALAVAPAGEGALLFNAFQMERNAKAERTTTGIHPSVAQSARIVSHASPALFDVLGTRQTHTRSSCRPHPATQGRPRPILG